MGVSHLSWLMTNRNVHVGFEQELFSKETSHTVFWFFMRSRYRQVLQREVYWDHQSSELFAVKKQREMPLWFGTIFREASRKPVYPGYGKFQGTLTAVWSVSPKCAAFRAWILSKYRADNCTSMREPGLRSPSFLRDQFLLLLVSSAR